MKSIARIFAILAVLAVPSLAFGQGAGTTTVPGQLMTNPVTMPFGTGAAKTMLGTSANTGFTNQFEITNTGTSSNSSTIATLGVGLGCSNCSGSFNALGGASPTLYITSGAGLTNGIQLNAGAAGSNIGLTPGSGGAVVVTGGFTATGLITNADLNYSTFSSPWAGPCNVKNAGAVGNGITSDQTAIQNLWNSGNCPVIYFPPGTYIVTNLTSPNANGTGIVGSGAGATISGATYASPGGTAQVLSGTTIQSSVTTGDVISVHTAETGTIFRDFNVTRTTIATTGCGLDMGASQSQAHLLNLVLMRNASGLCLGNTDYSEIDNVVATNNTAYGVTGTGSTSAFQWQMSNVVAGTNGSHGFTFVGLTGTCNSVGQWRGLASYGNGGAGFYASALAQIRLSDSFFGSDQTHEVYIQNSCGTSYSHLLTNVATELSTTGAGFEYDSTNASGLVCTNCSGVGNYDSGIVWDGSGNLQLVGGSFNINGAGASSGNNFGINIIGGTASVIGVTAISNNGTGIVVTSGSSACTILGNHATTSIACTTAYTQGNY